MHKSRSVGFEEAIMDLFMVSSVEMTPRSVADIIHRGGTVLRTARSEEFRTPAGRQLALDNISITSSKA